MLSASLAMAQNYPAMHLGAGTTIDQGAITGGTATGLVLTGNNSTVNISPSAALQSGSGNDIALNSYSALNDTAKATTSVYGLSLLHLLDVLPGGHTGARAVLTSEVDLNGPPAAGSDNHDYVAGYFRGVARGNAGGGPGNYVGAIFGLNPISECQAGASYMLDCTAMESDVGIYTGGSAMYRVGNRIASYGNVQGSLVDAAIHISTLGVAVPFHNGIKITNLGGGSNPVDGTLFSGDFVSGLPMSAQEGIDLNAWTFSGPAIASPGGFLVTNIGTVVTPGINTGFLTAAATIVAPANTLTAPVYPKTIWKATGNPTDQKNWQAYVDPTGNFQITALNDAETAAAVAISFNRGNGNTVASVGVTPLIIATGGVISSRYLTTPPASPTIAGGCGTGATVSTGSGDNYGAITLGSGSPTSCTISFATPYPTRTFCTASPAAAQTGYGPGVISSTAQLALNWSTGQPVSVWFYNCQGQ